MTLICRSVFIVIDSKCSCQGAASNPTKLTPMMFTDLQGSDPDPGAILKL